MSKVIPLGDRVLVKRTMPFTKSKGGILIPDIAQDKPKEGTVISVGEKAKDTKAGDKVIFASYAGNDVVIDGDGYLLMREEDIIAVVE